MAYQYNFSSVLLLESGKIVACQSQKEEVLEDYVTAMEGPGLVLEHWGTASVPLRQDCCVLDSQSFDGFVSR